MARQETETAFSWVGLFHNPLEADAALDYGAFGHRSRLLLALDAGHQVSSAFNVVRRVQTEPCARMTLKAMNMGTGLPPEALT